MKKDIPVAILTIIGKMSEKIPRLIKIIADDTVILNIVHADQSTGYYFKIIKQNSGWFDGIKKYVIEFKPAGPDSNGIMKWSGSKQDLDIYLTNWTNLLDAYENVQIFFEDPIIKRNQENFDKEFEIVDEDADIVPFDLKQQFFLDNYVSKAIESIEAFAKDKPAEEKEELASLVEEGKVLKKSISQEAKRPVIKKLSHFLGRAQKISLDLVKEIFVNVSAEVITKLITG